MRDVAAFSYGPVQTDELDAVNLLLEQALTFGVGGMAPWTESIGHAHLRVVRRRERPVAGLSVIPMGHWFGGQVVAAGGVTAVGVTPDQRGSGVGLWMMRQMLEEQHAAGVPLATLYPATTLFYRRAGFERAAQRIIYDVPLAATHIRDYALEAMPVMPDQYDVLKDMYRQQAARSASFIERPDFYWKLFLDPKDKPSYKFLVSRDDVPEGYVIFYHATHGEPLVVRDIVALTPAAGRRILTLLADHRSMLDTLRFPGGPYDPLLFLMTEQKQTVFRSLDLMARIVDVPAALAARGYLQSVQAELHFEVQDDLLPWNNGRFVMQVADGRGQAEPGGRGRMRLHVRDLAALYTGYFTPAELQQVGSLSADEADIGLATAVFAGPRPWLPDMF